LWRDDRSLHWSSGCASKPTPQPAHKSFSSKFEIIVVLVRANLKPVVIAVTLASDGAVTATDFDAVNTAFFAEAQRWMSRIRLKKSEIFVGKLLNVLGQLVITLPERRQCV
jgi:hypothetical protein